MKGFTEIYKIQGSDHLHYFEVEVRKVRYSNHTGFSFFIDFVNEYIPDGQHGSLGRYYSEAEFKRFITFLRALVKLVPFDILTRKHFMKWVVNSLKSCRITSYGADVYPWMD